MKPKEKAENLVGRMYLVHSNTASKITMYFAKECALIAVDEILSLMIKFHGRHIEDNSTEIGYWQEVKNEINKQDK